MRGGRRSGSPTGACGRSRAAPGSRSRSSALGAAGSRALWNQAKHGLDELLRQPLVLCERLGVALRLDLDPLEVADRADEVEASDAREMTVDAADRALEDAVGRDPEPGGLPGHRPARGDDRVDRF